MPAYEIDPLKALFVESFNLDLAALFSSACVALPGGGAREDVLELQDDERNFLAFIPADTAPEMAAVAYALYGQAFNRGIRAGEDFAWAKLRHLISLASG
jgi:hypothetical protein